MKTALGYARDLLVEIVATTTSGAASAGDGTLTERLEKVVERAIAAARAEGEDAGYCRAIEESADIALAESLVMDRLEGHPGSACRRVAKAIRKLAE